MDFSKQIEELTSVVNQEIRKLFLDKKPLSLYQPMFHLLSAGGKRIRPLLVILSCQAVGGKLENCLNAAVAVELLHTFTLVHDDIMDHDAIRRSKPTVHEKWDEATAILAGDGLVTLAYQVLLKTRHPDLQEVLKSFTDGLLVLCEGQALDKEFETREDVSLEAYEEMIEKKTARLIEVSCEMGTILGNASVEEKKNIGLFASSLGKAFQIQDDLLDIMSEEKVSGKPFGSDLIEKKKTYLTIHFINSANPTDKEKFQRLWKKDLLKREDVLQIRELFNKAGTIESARKIIKELILRATKALDFLQPGEAKDNLRKLALKIRDRVS